MDGASGRVTLEELIGLVGRERYDAACGWAWRTTQGTGSRHEPEPWPGDLDQVPHDLADLWDETSSSLGDRLALALLVYHQMPCYGNLMYVKHHYGDFDPGASQTLWDAFRGALNNSDARLADPVGYSLWCDYFEDPDTVERAWLETTRQDINPSTLRLRRVLEIAGPIPWIAKQQIFDDLIDDSDWHPFIYAALLGSAFDYFGKLDPAAAQRYLARLTLTDEAPNLVELYAKLGPMT